jgi:hypothetical protein
MPTSRTEITTVTTRTTTISITNTSTIPSTTTSDGSEIVILNISLYCSVLIILVFYCKERSYLNSPIIFFFYICDYHANTCGKKKHHYCMNQILALLQ